MCFLGRFDIFCWDILKKRLSIYTHPRLKKHTQTIPNYSMSFPKYAGRIYIQLPAFQQDSGSSRMLLHPQVKTTYLLSTAAVAGFLAREDGKSAILKKIRFAFSVALALKMLNQFLGNYKLLGTKQSIEGIINWLEVSHSGRLVPSVPLNTEDQPGIPWHVMEVQDSG